MKNFFSTIPEGIAELKKGKMLIVVDNPKRENQADVIFPAETATTEQVNFLIQECGGMVCVPILWEKAQKLDLALMVSQKDNSEKLKCKFTITTDAKNVSSFGISASDRALTIRTMAQKTAKKEDLVRPGHIFPIIAENGGVLVRQGHTEATIELVRRAGFSPSGVLCEVLNKDGSVRSGEDLFAFAKKFNLKIVSIADLVVYAKAHLIPNMSVSACSVIKVASSKLPTKYGKFTISIYKSLDDNLEHAVLVLGDIKKQPVTVRIHSQCVTGDTFFSLKCDCGEQLQKSMETLQNKGSGVILYLNQEGRGIGISNKIKAYALQDKGLDTIMANEQLGLPSDARSYEVAGAILCDLHISKIKLLTNNPCKIHALESLGIQVDPVPLEVMPNDSNKAYLSTKKKKMGHRLKFV